jgi:hypothetical protein
MIGVGILLGTERPLLAKNRLNLSFNLFFSIGF